MKIPTGIDIKKPKLKSLWKYIGLVQQEPVLFDASIYENILYGKEEASEGEVIEAAKFANAHSFICALPEGYSTKVGERGVQLSGGQKQRVAIARAKAKQKLFKQLLPKITEKNRISIINNCLGHTM